METLAKKPDYADLPYEVVVVERNAAGAIVHVEVCSRHTLLSEALRRVRNQDASIPEHNRERYRAELVQP